MCTQCCICMTIWGEYPQLNVQDWFIFLQDVQQSWNTFACTTTRPLNVNKVQNNAKNVFEILIENNMAQYKCHSWPYKNNWHLKHWTELEERILTHVQTLIIQLNIQWEHDIYHYTCHGVFPSDFGPCTYSNNSLLISNGAYDDSHGTEETLNRAEGSLWKNHELFQDSFISCNFLVIAAKAGCCQDHL